MAESTPASPPQDGRIVPANIAALFRDAAETFSDRPAFCSKGKNDVWETVSFRELYQSGLALATALIDLGLEPRSHVGLLADNRYEWILCDCGIQLAGAADVPRGTDITDGEIEHILSHADVSVVFVENLSTLEKLNRCRKKLKKIQEVILMSAKGGEPPSGVKMLEDLLERGRHLRTDGDRRAEERLQGIVPGDLVTLIYTSGTTGIPKGVMLTHANMVSQIRNLPFSFSPDDRALSILPVWHSYERVFEMVAISWGFATYYTSLRSIAQDLRSVKPTIMASAPRLWESLYQKILANVRSANPIRRGLFQAAYASACRVRGAEFFFRGQTLDLHGRSWRESISLGVAHLVRWLAFQIPYRILDPLVLKKLRGLVGGEFRGTISGGGALQPHVDEFYNFIGIPVLEGYGMTETSPVLAARTWKNLIIGTVGKFYPETEIRIVDLQSGEILYPNRKKRGGGRGLRGEIHARGPQIMKGYYKNPEATAKVLRDGWMNTGDIGMVTFNDCLKILGRSKETIVLLSGENVEPVPIEGKLVESLLIEQCMVVGQDQKYLSALIVPSLEAFREAGIHAANAGELSNHTRTKELLDADIRRLVCSDTGFKSFERIGDWRLLSKPFELGDELTNTFKIKRHVITERYQYLIDDIYF